MSDAEKVLGPGLISSSISSSRKAEKAASKSEGLRRKEIAEQKRKEQLRLAEEEDVLGRRRFRAKAGGRSLLVATSPTGRATTLGGI